MGFKTGWIGRWDWFMEVCHGGLWHWLDQGDGIDWWGHVMGAPDWIGVIGLICWGAMGSVTPVGSEWWDWWTGRTTLAGLVNGIDSWGHVTLAGSGHWDWFMGACHGDTWHWLDRGNGIDLCRCAAQAGMGWWDWFMGACHGGMWHWLDRGNGVDLWRCAALAGMGWWDWFMGACYGGTWHWLDQGDGIDLWGCAIGACITGWIGAMGLIYGDAPWGCATGSGWWDWLVGSAMGERDTGWIREMWLIHGGTRHWLDRGEGIDSWAYAMGPCDTGWIGAMGLIHRGVPWGRANLAGSGRWDWFMGVCDTGWTGAMGLIYGVAQHWLEWGNGIDLWGRIMGARDWIGEMGLICGGTPWGCDTGWMWDWVMGTCDGGRTTGSGWWNWFVLERHGGTRHWLDLGDGINLCGRAMGAHDTGWMRAIGLIHAGMPNDKVLYGCWI